ncbi:hypothetical protein HRbin36_01014 [bacterium HR36]|nr:hypothetical protein HRbin36_01014 [bacterium HR36]
MLWQNRIALTTALVAAWMLTGTLWADKKKEAPVDASTVTARVKSVDAAKSTLTVLIASKNGEKRVEEKTFTLRPQTRIGWIVGKGQEPKPAKLSELQPGDQITLHLSADGKEVEAVDALPPTLHGAIRAIAADRRTITVGGKGKDGPADYEVIVPAEAKILLSDGLSKNEAPKEGKLTDLSEGLFVSVALGLDRKTAQVVHAQGPSVSGTVRGFDTGTRTLTIQVKQDGQLVEKTYRLAANARIEGDVTPGELAQVRLSVHDSTTAVAVIVPKKK